MPAAGELRSARKALAIYRGDEACTWRLERTLVDSGGRGAHPPLGGANGLELAPGASVLQ